MPGRAVKTLTPEPSCLQTRQEQWRHPSARGSKLRLQRSPRTIQNLLTVTRVSSSLSLPHCSSVPNLLTSNNKREDSQAQLHLSFPSLVFQSAHSHHTDPADVS